MITGRDIREARALLQWRPERLAQAARLHLDVVLQAELLDSDAEINKVDAAAIQSALEGVGVVFARGEQPGVILRRNFGRRRSDIGPIRPI